MSSLAILCDVITLNIYRYIEFIVNLTEKFFNGLAVELLKLWISMPLSVETWNTSKIISMLKKTIDCKRCNIKNKTMQNNSPQTCKHLELDKKNNRPLIRQYWPKTNTKQSTTELVTHRNTQTEEYKTIDHRAGNT